MKYILFCGLLLTRIFAMAQTHKAPAFPGGTAAMIQFIQQHTAIPGSNIPGAGIYVQVVFDVSRKGAIRVTGLHAKDDATAFAHALAAAVQNMPAWTPGLRKGKKATMGCAVTGRFYLRQSPQGAPVPVFELEQPPRFPGGDIALLTFLRSTLEHPRSAADNDRDGTVNITFLVREDGSLHNIQTTGPRPGFGLEEAALRAVRAMPGWEPAIANGKVVAAQYSLLVRFVVQ